MFCIQVVPDLWEVEITTSPSRGTNLSQFRLSKTKLRYSLRR